VIEKREIFHIEKRLTGGNEDSEKYLALLLMTKTILVLGAGRSSASLIQYLLANAAGNWRVVVGDLAAHVAQTHIGSHPAGTAIAFDIADEPGSRNTIAAADVVISLVPATLHPKVARLCMALHKHLLTASYVSDEMKAMHTAALDQNLLFLNECGLDPGIDHMSAMQVIDRIRQQGGTLTTFESFTGGLIAPDTDPHNPWRYKFTWNPRNVVVAGQNTAKFLQNGVFKYIPYQQLFRRITPVTVPAYGSFEGYANRDSLQYVDTYGLQGIKTMLRGTLRYPGYCSAWNILVQLGCCDDTYELEQVGTMTHRQFINAFLPIQTGEDPAGKLAAHFNLDPAGPELQRLRWSGFFDEEAIGLTKATPAQIVEHILNKKWKLNPRDKDLVVMWHRFVYEAEGREHQIQASLVATGDDAVHTAMAKTVGLPLAIAAKLLLQNKISRRGVAIPTTPDFYDPILQELNTLGIRLTETHH
jgi:saccharopine dehydrogenase-like NADP-dependent oxidoreductase